jgi:Kinesin motor domain
MESNIQVAVRVRPKNAKEVFKTDVVQNDSERIKIIDSDKYIESVFDRVFGSDDSQEEVYSFISPMVESCDKGVSCTIMAYGQSGSGKTFTMFGEPEKLGIIPRVVSHIFQLLPSDFTILCSMIQIYNEKLYDMLQDRNFTNSLAIKQDPLFGVYIVNLTEYVIQSPEDALEIIKRGEANRAIRVTNMSQSSSRSHTICQITVESSKPNAKGNLSRAKVNLCDLAGSERLGKTGISNDEILKETTNINRSLTALGRIIYLLANKKKDYIPYRDSRLTYLLKDSLEGRTRVCFIANISPTNDTTNESIQTLKFASKAKEISLHAEANEISVADNKLIQRLQKEIRYLKDCMKISKNSENLHEKLWNLQEENQRLKEGLTPVDLDKILQENKRMKAQLQKLMEITGNSFTTVDVEEDELDKFCDRYKSAPIHRDMTPLVINPSRAIEVRIRNRNNSVEKKTTVLDKTIDQLEKEKNLFDQAILKNKRLKTLEQIHQFREKKAIEAIEKYEKTKINETEVLKKIDLKEKQYSEINIKKLREADIARNILAKAEMEKKKALQDLEKVRQRRESRSPLKCAATQQIFLPRVN